jgi:hypothetical protein
VNFANKGNSRRTDKIGYLVTIGTLATLATIRITAARLNLGNQRAHSDTTSRSYNNINGDTYNKISHEGTQTLCCPPFEPKLEYINFSKIPQ